MRMAWEGKIALLLPAENLGNEMISSNLGNEMICEATRRIIKRLPARYNIEEYSFLKTPRQEEIDQVNACDRAIFAGTNIFQPQAVGWKLRTQDLKQIRIPYALYGVGYSGPMGQMPLRVSKETKDLIKWSRGAEAIGVRDPQTSRWLGLFGVNSELIGCPVLAYPDTFTDVTLGQSKPLLAIREILLHNTEEESAAAQRTLTDWFFKEYPSGACVVQEPADLKMLKGKAIVTDFREIVTELSKARLVLSTRLHAGMLALAFGRPVVFLAHDTRVESFCDMIGLKSYKLTFDGLSEVVKAVKRVENGDLSEFKPVVERLPALMRALHSFLREEITGAQTKRMQHPNWTSTMLLRKRRGLHN
jgi:hypothetical protein